MKFSVEPRDAAIFGGACLGVLYICCLAVLNASSLVGTGEFYGLLPFEAFTGKYIGATLMLFILVVLGVVLSLNSYIFDREAGFGFSLTKKSDGYSRWARKGEVKRQLCKVDPKAYSAEHAGLVVMNNGRTLWVDDGEAHNIVIGATGSGKTQAVVFPLVQCLAKKGESMIITDPKGEIYEQTASMLKERGYNIVLLNFRSPQNGNGWNPMALPYQLYKEGNTDKAIELLDDLALNILYEEKTAGGDPFWEKTAADYFSGLALGLFDDAKESQINLNSMNLMSSLGEERFGGPNNNYIKEYFNSKDPSRPAYVNASGTVYAPEETKGGVLSTFKQKVKLFSSRDNLSEMLCHSDFDMKEIGRQRTVVYMIVQDEKKTLHPLATIFIKQCYETLIDVAQESGGKLPFRTNFILDEFANMPPLKDVTTMVTAARSRLIRFTFIIQNYAQLTQVYGKESAETIKGNCNIMYLISSELQALEELSKLCGEVKSKDKDKTSSTPLVTVSDLQRLKQYETISLRLRTMPFKTKLVPNWQMDWGKKYDKSTYPSREKKQVELFDIREFVKNLKKQKMNEMMGNNESSGTNPMLDGLGVNPMFGNSEQNPLFNSPSPASSDNESFNVDDLVKRIDAKIAELEEEERREKENEINPTNSIQATNIPDEKLEFEDDDDNAPVIPVTNPSQVQYQQPMIEPPITPPSYDHPEDVTTIDQPIFSNPAQTPVNLQQVSTNNINKNGVPETNDDKFFDDFFSDE